MGIAPFLPGITASILIANTPAHKHPDLDEPSIEEEAKEEKEEEEEEE